MLYNLKQKVNIKYFMVAYVGFLLVFSSYMFGDSERFIKGIAIVFLYAFFDILWTYVRDKMWYLPISSWISGLILAIVAIPNPSIPLILFLPILAVASKQLLRFGKNRHIFNPASLAMALAALVMPSISWWGVAWGTTPLVIVSIVGIFILWRQSRWDVTIPFYVSFVVLLAGYYILNVEGFNLAGISIPEFLRTQLIDPTIIFFSTVMLIEPLTSTFPARSQRIIYGVLVAFFSILITWLAQWFVWENQDPFVYGLLLGNVTASLLFLPRRLLPTPKTQSSPTSSSPIITPA